GHGSTGASNDLAEATNLAVRMVREFGLSPALGPVGYSDQSGQFLGGPVQDGLRRPYSEETQRVVDQEVSRLLREAEERGWARLRAPGEGGAGGRGGRAERGPAAGGVVLAVPHAKGRPVPRAGGPPPGGTGGPPAGGGGPAPGGPADGPRRPATAGG